MTREEADFIGAMNMCDEISDEAYKKIMCHCEEQEPCVDVIGRKFEEIVAEYPPAELCTYPEYKGKPYYSIKYEENGEHFVGFGTYNPGVLSRYLKEYFMTGTKIK